MLLIAAAHIVALQIAAASGDAAQAKAQPAAYDLSAKPAAAAIPYADPVVKQEVKELLAAEPLLAKAPEHAEVLSADDKYRKFDEQFEAAKVSDCLHPDALKFMPPTIGPIVFGGLLSLPWLAAATLKGKCH